MKYDIFISYKRRGTSSATAAYLYELLLKKGYNVFFDRKELRSGMFDEQLLTHISDAKDVIILLEETSLDACFDQQVPDYYKSDWFCKEVMHALSLPGKNVIPILLENYKMPSIDSLPKEMKNLSRCQALSLEISEVEEFYQKYFVDMEYLKSLPTNISRFRQNKSKKASISNLLFFYEGFCYDINEYGEYITTIDENNDENHPYKHGVEFAGEHKILCINNDTCERTLITTEVAPYHQKYICVEWAKHQLLWTLTESDVQKEEDPEVLYYYGKGLFEGTRTHEPNLEMSLLCFDKAIEKQNNDAIEFIKNCWGILCDRKVLWIKRKLWIERAAKLGVIPAMRYLGKAYSNDRNYEMCCKWYREAIKNGDVLSMLEVAKLFSEPYIVWPFTLTEISNGLANNLSDFLLKIENVANGEELYQLGDLYYREERRDKKINFKRSSLDIYKLSAAKGFAQANLRIGFIYEDRNDFEKAISYYNKIKNNSEKYLTMGHIARCLHCLGKKAEALEKYKCILQETNNNIGNNREYRLLAYLGIAGILKQQADVSGSVETYEHILKEYNPHNEIALANLALMAEQYSSIVSQKAETYYSTLLEICSPEYLNNYEYLFMYSHLSVEVIFCLAHAYANGIGCKINQEKALKYYYACSFYYSFVNDKGIMKQTGKTDIERIINSINMDDGENVIRLGFIYYELFSDSKKAKEILNTFGKVDTFNLFICDPQELLNLIDEEDDGKNKNEKRKKYYLTNDKDRYYKSIRRNLLKILKEYGRQQVLIEIQNGNYIPIDTEI